MQKDPTLIDVSCCVHLHSFCILLRIARSCCAKFETGQTLEQAISNISFVLWSPKRGATMLDSFAQLFQHPRTQTTHGLQSLMGCILPTICTAAPNIVGNAHHCQHCWLNNVGSWPCSRGSKTNPNFQLVNKPSAGAVLRDQSTRSFTVVIDNTVYHLVVKNKKGEGRGFKKREIQSLLTFFPWKGGGGGGGAYERGGLKRRFTVLWFDVFFPSVRRDTSTCLVVFFFSYFGAKTILKLLFFVATTKSYLLHHPISIRGSHMKIIGQWK